nr:hypothetical protein [Tanacetum cinerariifolium]
MNQFYEMKGILRQFSVARTPQKNRVAKRRNMTLIEAVRTILVDSKLPTTFWAEVVNTACYVQNKVLVVKPRNKTRYEIFHGRTLTLSFMRPFGCLVTILNTIDHLGKFDGKADEGLVRIHQTDWLFDIDALTRTMNYEPLVAGTQSNDFADLKSSNDDGSKPSSDDGKKVDEDPRKENECNDQEKEDNVNRTNNVNIISSTINTAVQMELMMLKELCNTFERLMHEKFQMSSMGELTFFLGLQVKQTKDGIFISQDKYVAKILKKFRFTKIKTTSTPMETQKPLLKDEDGEEVDVYMYRFVQTFLDTQLDDLSTHKRIYIAPSPLKKIFRNMRRVGKGFSGRVTPLFPTMVHQLGEGLAILTDPQHIPTIIQPSSSRPQKTQKPRKPKERTPRLVRAATTAYNLEVEQDSGNITKTQSKETPNEPSSYGTDSGGGPRCQETMRDTTAQTRFESVFKHSNDSLLTRGNTLQSDEDRMKLDELMALRTTLQNKVLDLEKTKTTQHYEIASLKRRVKKLEKKNRSRTHRLKRLYKVGLTARVESSRDEEILGEDASKQERMIDDIDADEDITMVNDADNEMFDVDMLGGKSTTTTTIISQESKDKGKGIMIEEPVKPKKKDQIRLVEEAALKLQARVFRRVNTFEDIKTEFVKGKEKRTGEELIQENTMKQKVEDDKETAALKQLMEIIPDEEEVAIDAIPLAVKSSRIVDWKIHKEGKKSYYQIVRANEKSRFYADLHVGRKEVSSYTTYTFNDAGEKLQIDYESEMAY